MEKDSVLSWDTQDFNKITIKVRCGDGIFFFFKHLDLIKHIYLKIPKTFFFLNKSKYNYLFEKARVDKNIVKFYKVR